MSRQVLGDEEGPQPRQGKSAKLDQISNQAQAYPRQGLSLSLNAAPDPRADAARVEIPGETSHRFSHTAHSMTA